MFNTIFLSPIKSLYILICLIPLTLLSGPFLPDLIITLMSIILIYRSIAEKDFYLFQNRIFKFFFVYWILIIFCSLVSEYKINSLQSSLPYLRFLIFSLAVCYIFSKDKTLLKNFTIILVLVYTLALINGFYQYFLGYNFFGISPSSPNRLTLIFDDRMLLGAFLSRTFPLLIGLIIYTYKDNIKKYLLLFFLIISSDILVYLSGERTALGLLLLSTLLFIIFINKFRILRLATLIISIFCISIISLNNNNIKHRNIDYTLNQLGLYSESESINIFSPNHDKLIKSSISMFLDSPIFGVGPNNFRIKCVNVKFDKGFCSTHPHNMFVQILAELGVLGLIFYMIALTYIIYFFLRLILMKISKKITKVSDYQICLMICFTITLFPLYPSMNIFNNWINVLYFMPLGFYMASFNYNDGKIIL